MTTPSKHQICKSCGGELTYKLGTSQLCCNHCGATQEIASTSIEHTTELNFKEYLAQAENNETKVSVKTTSCSGCHAHITLAAEKVADSCPYCGTSIIATKSSTKNIIVPKALLPFKLRERKGTEVYQKWVKGRWLAPNNFKRQALKHDRLSGIYIPYWTFDTDTVTTYSGKRGTVHRHDKGSSTSWRSASGSVHISFDDTLVVASESLPHKYVDKLEPWDLGNLVSFESDYLRGFQAEQYQIDLSTGFIEAQGKMEKDISRAIRRDIGGDKQKISSQFTNYTDITFKHILLPVWVTAYQYKGKVFRTVINARTGEVQGERPWSWIKITTVLFFLIVITGFLTLGGDFHLSF